MITIQYQILRYLPDRVSGEFVNLGIVAFDPSNGTLKSKFITKIGKISSFFPNINSRFLIKSVKTIHEDLDTFSTRLQSEFAFKRFNSLDEITKSVLPKDDSALIFSDIKKTLDINPEATVDDLFSRFVSIHLTEEDDEEVRRDKEVWNKVYKKHFDDYGISSHLSAHKVKTKNDELEFEKAWKNGAWNCFESVSFNLTRPDAIKNKVYKWVGKLDELNSSSEQVHIYLLSILPHGSPELDKFINKTIKGKATENLKIDLVSESNVTTIVKQIKKEIDKHS
ncbi:DUF3037 domain-containing protein [Pseudoflavitalea sp. X16]|uniref:DUF3037 domain-containing protein n=1 Tax=Paraflavitalea devenefica TaxID=2716334 RepID=UPI001422F986|nr:DUF3037 domain-containing protein [Paraflavitalea devenefica]NII25779.1 DUF3037 domain-containing protein [Paraflavitalea devenefica]